MHAFFEVHDTTVAVLLFSIESEGSVAHDVICLTDTLRDASNTSAGAECNTTPLDTHWLLHCLTNTFCDVARLFVSCCNTFYKNSEFVTVNANNRVASASVFAYATRDYFE